MSRVRLIIVGIAVGLVAYVGGYLALLDPGWAGDVSLQGSAGYRYPAYRVGGAFADAAFQPAAWVDQQVRPGYWAYREEPNEPRSP